MPILKLQYKKMKRSTHQNSSIHPISSSKKNNENLPRENDPILVMMIKMIHLTSIYTLPNEFDLAN